LAIQLSRFAFDLSALPFRRLIFGDPVSTIWLIRVGLGYSISAIQLSRFGFDGSALTFQVRLAQWPDVA
jgi:hypothetical protein